MKKYLNPQSFEMRRVKSGKFRTTLDISDRKDPKAVEHALRTALTRIAHEARKEEALWWFKHENELIKICKTQNIHALKKHGEETLERTDSLLTKNIEV